MSLNAHTASGIHPVGASRLRITNSVRADTTPQTLTVTETLGGLASYAASGAPTVLNLPTAAILISSQMANGIQEGNCFPYILRNRGANTVTLTPGTGGTMDPAGGGAVATATNRSYLLRIDDVTPASENYTVFDVTDTGLQI